jgi:hypothetical protein
MTKQRNLFGLNVSIDEDDISKKIEDAKEKFATIEHKAQVYKKRTKLFKIIVWTLCTIAMCLLFSVSLIQNNETYSKIFAFAFSSTLISILIVAFYLYHMDGVIWDAKYYTPFIYYGMPERIFDFISKENIIKAEVNYIGNDLFLSLYSKKDKNNINEVPRRVDFGGFEKIETKDINASFVNINTQKYYQKI